MRIESLAKIPLQQALERLAVAGLVAGWHNYLGTYFVGCLWEKYLYFWTRHTKNDTGQAITLNISRFFLVSAVMLGSRSSPSSSARISGGGL